MILLSHPTGNSFVRHTLQAARELGALEAFYTTIAVSQDWGRFLPESLRQRVYAIDRNELYLRPLREIARLATRFLKDKQPRWASTDAVYTALDSYVARSLKNHSRLRAVYAYEDGALETFIEAKKRGIQCIYELPIAYWETVHRLLEQEAKRLPDWAPTLGSQQDGTLKCARKTRELELADCIVCPSNFVLNSIPEAIRQRTPCHVIPYGADIISSTTIHKSSAGPLQVLFVGSLSQRKGLADLFAAINQLPQSICALTVLGTALLPLEFYQKRCPRMTYLSPRPRTQVLHHMCEADILVLPSIVEGRALVQLEALSCALPLVITENTGGANLIVEGETGFIVPTGAPQVIAEKLHWLFENRRTLAHMQQSALTKAQEVDWKHFRDTMKTLFENFLSP